MEDMGLGAGLAAMAFWGFIAACVLGGMWYSIRQRESQQETLRRLIESGQSLDEDVLNKVLSLSDSSSKNLDRDLKISGYIVLPIAPGMAIFAMILGSQRPEALAPMIGVSVLILTVGVGLLWAAKVAERWKQDDNAASLTQKG